MSFDNLIKKLAFLEERFLFVLTVRYDDCSCLHLFGVVVYVFVYATHWERGVLSKRKRTLP